MKKLRRFSGDPGPNIWRAGIVYSIQAQSPLALLGFHERQKRIILYSCIMPLPSNKAHLLLLAANRPLALFHRVPNCRQAFAQRVPLHYSAAMLSVLIEHWHCHNFRKFAALGNGKPPIEIRVRHCGRKSLQVALVFKGLACGLNAVGRIKAVNDDAIKALVYDVNAARECLIHNYEVVLQRHHTGSNDSIIDRALCFIHRLVLVIWRMD